MNLAVREVRLAFKRAPLLGVLGAITIAFSLYAFGLFGLVAVNIQQALRDVEERVEVRAFLIEQASDGDVEDLMQAINRMPEVAGVGYVSPDSALQRARAELAEFRDVMDGVFLPGSVELRLKPGMRDPVHVDRVSERLRRFGIVEEVRYGREWVEKLYRIRNVAGLAGTVLGGVFALVAVIIIGSTIRVSVLARAREIEIMRLVGATDGFIRLPYLLDGAIKGFVGGLVALLLSWITTAFVSSTVMQVRFFAPSHMLLGILAGAILGLLVSWGSVGRHLQRMPRQE